MVIGDGMIGQMMEPVEFPAVEVGPPLDPGDWALTGCKGRPRRIVNSLFLDALELNDHNVKLKQKFGRITAAEQRWEMYNCEEKYDVIVTAFGMMARICRTAVDELKAEGVNVGLFRPITIKPYPFAPLRKAMDKAKRVLCVEMNMGQMLEDVRMACEGTKPIDFFGRAGGVVPSVQDVLAEIRGTIAKIGK